MVACGIAMLRTLQRTIRLPGELQLLRFRPVAHAPHGLVEAESLWSFVEACQQEGDEKAPLRNEFAISTSVSLMTISKIFADLFAAKTRSDQFILAAAVGGVAPLFFVVLERYSSWDVSSDPPKREFGWG